MITTSTSECTRWRLTMSSAFGAEDTIREVYHLERPVADFEATLAALCAPGAFDPASLNNPLPAALRR